MCVNTNTIKCICSQQICDFQQKDGVWWWFDTEVKDEFGKGFSYTVTAEVSGKETAPVTKSIFRLDKPVITKVEAKSKNSIKVTWTREKVHSYLLQYSTDSKNWISIKKEIS